MNDKLFKYDIKLFKEQLRGLNANIYADKIILSKYLSCYLYNNIFHGYDNKLLLDEFLKIGKGIKVQQRYLNLTSKLVLKYKKTRDEYMYQHCNQILEELINFQDNRDLYFFRLCEIFNTSLSRIEYYFPDDVKNMEKEYIEKIDNMFKKVK